MEKTFKFTSRWDTEYEIKFVKCSYCCDGSLAIEALNKDEGGEWWEDYGTLTVNLGYPLLPGQAFLDTNNLPDLADFVMERGWAEQVGMEASGFCVYPLVEFTDEFLTEICEEDE